MIVYYQNELQGKEIADSIRRYLHYCLAIKEIKAIEIRCNIGKKLIDDWSNKHLLVFTNGDHDFTYWITLINNIISDIKEKEYYINIIDLTLQYDFPITVDSAQIVSILNDGCKDWLSKLTKKFLAQKNQIKLKENYIGNCKKTVQHFIKRNQMSIEDYINDKKWYELKETLLKHWEDIIADEGY